MASLLARTRPLRPLSLLICGLLPIVAAAGCGPTFVPGDSDASDADTGGTSSGGTSSGTGGEALDAESTGGGENASGGQMASDAPEFTGGAASTGGTSGAGGESPESSYDCNADHIICLPIVAPEPCPTGEVYSVEGSCYGACVPVGQCACESAADCPDPNGTDEYTCHGTTDRCGPWL